MDIDTAANPAGGDDTRVDVTPTASDAPAPEANAPAGGTDAQTSNEPNTDDLADLIGPEPEEDEYEEIERGEKKYKVPKALKSELLMHQDYTRKTMELADQRRALEAAKAEVEQARTLTTEERRAYAKVESLNEQVVAYEKVDWDALEAADPQEAQRHWRTYQQALNQRNQAIFTLQQYESQKAQQAQQIAAKRREEVEAAVAKEIPNWPARKVELERFAAEHGYAPEVLAETADAKDFKLLHLAEIGSRFIQRQRAAAKAAAQNAVKPAPEVSGTAAAGADPSRMTMEQYAAWRAANP